VLLFFSYGIPGESYVFQGHMKTRSRVGRTDIAANGTVVRIEPDASSKESRSPSGQLLRTPTNPIPCRKWPKAWKAVARPIPKTIPTSVDPDDYPLFWKF